MKMEKAHEDGEGAQEEEEKIELPMTKKRKAVESKWNQK